MNVISDAARVTLGRTVEVLCRATLTERSMFSAWMVGLEDEPDRCGEICIVEVFGDSVTTGDDGRPVVALGCGVHAFRDPMLVEEFSAQPHPIDVGTGHRYAVDWRPGRVEFSVDGTPIKVLNQAPDYPMHSFSASSTSPTAPRPPGPTTLFRSSS